MKKLQSSQLQKNPFDFLCFVKRQKNILLMVPHRHNIILNKGKDSYIDTRWHTRSIQIKVNTLNGTYHYYSKYNSETIKFSRKLAVIKRELPYKKKEQ